MAVFDWVESAGTSLDEEPKVSSTRFGDGYEERAPAGLNPITQRWNVQFTEIDQPVAQEIVDFFRARINAMSGHEAFDWTPLWHTTAIRVVCRRWSAQQGQKPDEVTVQATFEQVHEA
jgi:phage-related protein